MNNEQDTLNNNSIRVFPKRISVNSVNHDKIQKWYGYQSYYQLTDTLLVPVNRYITSTSNEKYILITTSG